jgi:hypothetical protein
MKCVALTSFFLQWFSSHDVMAQCFRNVPRHGKFWNTGASATPFTSFTLKFGSWMFLFGCAHSTPQLRSCNCPVFELSSYKSRHLTGVYWGWCSLELIPDRFWTKIRRNFLWSIWLPRDYNWYNYSVGQLGPRGGMYLFHFHVLRLNK